MNAPQDGSSALPTPQRLQIDELCVRFEADLQSGLSPEIEAVVEAADGNLRAGLLHELLLVELEFREGQGVAPDSAEYLERFPEDERLIEAAFAVHGSRAVSQVSETKPRDRRAGSPASDSQLSDSSHHGRFLPGVVLADRYRIVSMLGRGGMGEVYRADDLRLGQTVALKFLPPDLAQDPRRLDYFHEEVRLTRQISHPNVCRVYDIGEVDGQYFLSMEYIDGEDLKVLLRRIGRLPRDKGVQIAQQLCAGLAAAHEKGVLHRDLKPANIMIDGRGQVRITDFGLARLAGEEAAAGVAGTPAYMAPEQLRHGRTSVRSDVYALGLLLYEMFTGKPANQASKIEELIDQRESGPASKPSSVVDDMDPVVERAILRCLEPEPHERPKSATAVAAALPGGDVLAAALAAGETPSPEMLDAAAETRLIHPRTAIALLLLAIVPMLAYGVSVRVRDINWIDLPLEPAVLKQRCRDYLQELGYTSPFADSASGFLTVHVSEDEGDVDAPETDQTTDFRYWYRASQDVLRPVQKAIRIMPVEEPNPPQLSGEQAGMRLDPQGRLTDFWAFSKKNLSSDSSSREPSEPDWSRLFPLVADELPNLEPAKPRFDPSVPTDYVKAWTGAGDNGSPFRLEAGAYRGHIVWAKVNKLPAGLKWIVADLPIDSEHNDPAARFSWPVFFCLLALAVAAAWRNVVRGRVHRLAALRMGIFAVVIHQLWWLFGISRLPFVWEGVSDELLLTLGTSLVHGVLVALLVMSCEPFVRRWWPESLIGWNRLLTRGFNDPLVARDVLVGLAGAGALVSIYVLVSQIVGENWAPRFPPSNASQIAGGAFLSVYLGTMLSSAMLFLAVIVRACTKQIWLGALATGFLAAGLLGLGMQGPEGPLFYLAFPLIGAALLVGELLVGGALPVAVTVGVLFTLPQEYSTRLDHWPNTPNLIGMALYFLLAAWAFRKSLMGRSTPSAGQPTAVEASK